MSDEKAIEAVTYVALERGFVRGRLVEVGGEFTFTGKQPKWAVVKGQGAPIKSAKPLAGDTKPEDARRAVKRKAAGLAGE